MIPIDFLQAGELAKVAEVVGGGEAVHRLQELGFRQGSRVEMLQPGTPCIVRLQWTKFCFRHYDDVAVLVRPSGDPS